MHEKASHRASSKLSHPRKSQVVLQPEQTPSRAIQVEVLSWIENVIVPALVDKFIAEKVLRKGEKG
jgi:hypothetical protein